MFEHSIDVENISYPPKENPGPGQYSGRLDKNGYKSSNNTSSFKSKVPNCKDKETKAIKPGPGYYNGDYLLTDFDRIAKANKTMNNNCYKTTQSLSTLTNMPP